jgi:diguanylate cyclase (GGDEF)-like protein
MTNAYHRSPKLIQYSIVLSALILLVSLPLMPFITEGQQSILLLLLALGWGGEIIIGLVLLRQMITLREQKLLFAQVCQQTEELRREVETYKRIEAQLVYAISHDALTGLGNRMLFMERLHQAIAFARHQQGYRFAVLFLDLDHFKAVNDSLGHAIGDQLLIGIAQRLRMCLRTGDTVARLGGDEFVVLLEDAQDLQQVSTVADRIQASLQQPFDLDGHQLFASASIGIVADAAGYDQAEAVLRDADIAMYQAKLHGKARSELFQPRWGLDPGETKNRVFVRPFCPFDADSQRRSTRTLRRTKNSVLNYLATSP